MVEKLPRTDVIEVISISRGTQVGYTEKCVVLWRVDVH